LPSGSGSQTVPPKFSQNTLLLCIIFINKLKGLIVRYSTVSVPLAQCTLHTDHSVPLAQYTLHTDHSVPLAQCTLHTDHEGMWLCPNPPPPSLRHSSPSIRRLSTAADENLLIDRRKCLSPGVYEVCNLTDICVHHNCRSI
jgi:hypothetical protein